MRKSQATIPLKCISVLPTQFHMVPEIELVVFFKIFCIYSKTRYSLTRVIQRIKTVPKKMRHTKKVAINKNSLIPVQLL